MYFWVCVYIDLLFYFESSKGEKPIKKYQIFKMT